MRIVRVLALVAGLVALAGAPSAAGDAIPRGNGGTLLLGAHWGPYETFGGTSFRWVDNDAEIVLLGGSGEAHVRIACEGGPSLGRITFPLRVFDGALHQVDHVVCGGAARPAELLLPFGGARTRYVLHADGGGRRVAGERRILNFRVFSLDDGRRGTLGDVVAPRSGLRIGTGWYPVEDYNGEVFRWMHGDGRLMASSDRAARATLRLQLEIGPSVGARSAQISVRDGRGRIVYHTTLAGRSAVAVPVELDRGRNTFTIAIASRNRRVPHDPRLLNLRLFGAALAR
jgi:hypothetical protein